MWQLFAFQMSEARGQRRMSWYQLARPANMIAQLNILWAIMLHQANIQ